MGEENDFIFKVFISIWLCPGSKFWEIWLFQRRKTVWKQIINDLNVGSARCGLGCWDVKVMGSTCTEIPGAMRTYLQFLISSLSPALPGSQSLLSPVGLYLLGLARVCSPIINPPSSCGAEAITREFFWSHLKLIKAFFRIEGTPWLVQCVLGPKPCFAWFSLLWWGYRTGKNAFPCFCLSARQFCADENFWTVPLLLSGKIS